jgi:hypothetical protein
VCVVCLLSGRGSCEEVITRPEESYDCLASLFVINKPCGRGGRSPRWAAEPQKIINNDNVMPLDRLSISTILTHSNIFVTNTFVLL